jgi:hypothetical protein
VRKGRFRKGCDIHVHMDAADIKYVRTKSANEGISISEIVRTYICWGIELEKQDGQRKKNYDYSE